jgi:hypothetical protein
MLWLHFGDRRWAPTDRDPDRDVGEFAVHVSCAWRVSARGGVVTGRSDIYVPADPDEDEEQFRWDRPGHSIVDQQLRSWIEAHVNEPLVVLDVTVDRCAGFTLRFANSAAFEVFPDAFSMPHEIREQWRIFRPAREAPHFVVNNQGWG